MTISDFNLLTVAERSDVVKTEGKHLFTHLEKDVNSVFYALDDFGAEMWISNDSGEIVDVQPIRKMAA
jgi:hypothetical protein